MVCLPVVRRIDLAVTTREATPFLSRTGETDVERQLRDWGLLLCFGAVQWPWLLKSLYGGRKRDKAALLARLELSVDALPNLGGWKADVGLLNLVLDVIAEHKPQTVVELGAGASSLVVAKALQQLGLGGRLISYDQHADFVRGTRSWIAEHSLSADLRHAPLTAPSGKWSELWYDLQAIPDTIDLLRVDGPPWALNPLGRGKAQRLFDRIPRGGIIILDDAARPSERTVASQWKRDWPDFEWTFVRGIKGTLIGRRG
jgi:predicted O-methyltransferase YrrM